MVGDRLRLPVGRRCLSAHRRRVVARSGRAAREYPTSRLEQSACQRVLLADAGSGGDGIRRADVCIGGGLARSFSPCARSDGENHAACRRGAAGGTCRAHASLWLARRRPSRSRQLLVQRTLAHAVVLADSGRRLHRALGRFRALAGRPLATARPSGRNLADGG